MFIELIHFTAFFLEFTVVITIKATSHAQTFQRSSWLTSNLTHIDWKYIWCNSEKAKKHHAHFYTRFFFLSRNRENINFYLRRTWNISEKYIRLWLAGWSVSLCSKVEACSTIRYFNRFQRCLCEEQKMYEDVSEWIKLGVSRVYLHSPFADGSRLSSHRR